MTQRGNVLGETRTIIGLTVTNNEKVPVGVGIEREDTKESFEGVILPGETKTIVTSPLMQKWNPDRIGGMWDGLNIRWTVPARSRTR